MWLSIKEDKVTQFTTAINQICLKIVPLVLTATILMVSCKENKKVSPEFVTEGLAVKVTASMGDFYPEKNPMPIIGNMASFVDNNGDSIEILILSPRIEKNEMVAINSIGALIYSQSNANKELIVAVPSSENRKSLDISDLMDLSVHHGNIKRMIEQWYDGCLPKETTKVIRWENNKYINEKLLNQ